MATPVGFDGRAGRFRWPSRSFSMAAPVGFDGRVGNFRWPRRSFSAMAAPVAGNIVDLWPLAAIATHLCPYEAQ